MGLTIIGKTRIVMVCIKYRDGCPSRARLDLESDVFSVSGEYLCPKSKETQTEISKVVSRIKRKSEISQGTLRGIFDKKVNQSEVGGYTSFPRLETYMFKRGRMHRPQVPLNSQNAMSLLGTCDEEFKIYYAFSIEGMDQSEVAIAFMGPRWKTTFQSDTNESLVQADATFYVVPRQFTSY